MKMKHMLIEGFCGEKTDQQIYPCKNSFKMGIHCFTCPQFSYTSCPNEIALSNENGIIEHLDDFIGFGGDMEPKNIEDLEKYIDVWKKICRAKIVEAHAEYMDTVGFEEI